MAKNEKTFIKYVLAPFFLTIFIILGIYIVRGFAPFGIKSLAYFDANIDYLDVFAYLHDVLKGKSSLGYSFSKVLGGNMFGVLSTGYFSPLNLIVVFFEKSKLNDFFDIIVMLKCALAALTMSIFLQKRVTSLKKIFVIVLSVSFALCQYNIAQSSNIFFLEGMYMLPLFMLGTYNIIRRNSPYVLLFSVAYNIAFGWYTGAMNCIFTVAWALFEFFWYSLEERQTFKSFVLKMVIFAYAAITGVCMSLIIYYPTIKCLQKSSEGSLDLSLFLQSNEFLGNAITVVTNYTWRSTSSLSMVSLFCGSIVLVCCISVFFSSRFSLKQKGLLGILLLFVVMMFYWKFLYLVFSLFKYVGSFWSRYSYLGIFALIFIAAIFLQNIEEEKSAQKKLPEIAIFVSALILLYNKDVTDVTQLKCLYATCFSIVFISIVLKVFLEYKNKKYKKLCIIVLSAFAIFEISCNAALLMEIYSMKDINSTYINYVNDGEKQINSIKASDNGLYRISQTSTRFMSDINLTANYDEAAMLNYWSLEMYTSVPDDNQRNFLDRAGYRINGEDMHIVNTSILPIDSLLGVKYILSKYPIEGLVEDASLPLNDGKKVYRNPYAFPMAFINTWSQEEKLISDEIKELEKGESINPFEYQNYLFSQLMGDKVEVFVPVAFDKVEENLKNTYILEVPKGNYGLYGNFPWAWQSKETIFVNGTPLTDYARWLSPSVFYIPKSGDTVEISVTSNEGLSIKEEQFYAVNLDLLQEISAEIQNKAVTNMTIKDGYAEFEVNSGGQEAIYTSIPYDEHWDITVNGEKKTPELFGDCLMMFPLENGNNHIVMTYHIGGFKEGAFAFGVGVILLIIWMIFVNKKRKKQVKNEM